MRYDAPDLFPSLESGVAVGLATARERLAAQDALTDAERRRQSGFGNSDRRVHFGLGRLALRKVAAARLGIGPKDVEIRIAADGAPEVDGLHVSISHGGAGDAAVGLAAVGTRAVGVDVEPIQERRPDLWRRILRHDELATLTALGGPSDRAHTLLWSMKEAVLKGQRTGLRAGARSVRLDPFGTDGDRGVAQAWSDTSGAWALWFTRRNDLWLVVATSASDALARPLSP